MHTTKIHYPKDKSSFTLRVCVTLVATLFVLFLLVNNDNKTSLESLALGFLVIAGTFDLSVRLHRLIRYDEICFDDKTFVVKKKNVILSETPIEKITVHSQRNPFNFSQSSWKRLYCNDKLLFHYETNEIDNDAELLLAKVI